MTPDVWGWVRRRVVLMFASALLPLLSGVGCGTARGFGKDVEKAGEQIQEGTR